MAVGDLGRGFPGKPIVRNSRPQVHLREKHFAQGWWFRTSEPGVGVGHPPSSCFFHSLLCPPTPSSPSSPSSHSKPAQGFFLREDWLSYREEGQWRREKDSFLLEGRVERNPCANMSPGSNETAQGIKLNESRQGAQLLFSERKCQVWLHLLLARGYKWNKNKPTLQPTFNCLIAAASQSWLSDSSCLNLSYGADSLGLHTRVAALWGFLEFIKWKLDHSSPGVYPCGLYSGRLKDMGSFKTFASSTRIISSLGFYFEIANLVSFCVDVHFLPPALTLWWNTGSLTFELKPLLSSI